MLVIVIYLFLLSVVLAQPPDCGSLNIEPTLEFPLIGSDLMFCQTDDLQCCFPQYFEKRRNETLDQLSDGLKLELISGNYELLQTAVSALDRFINETFLEGFIDRFPGVYAIRPTSRSSLSESFVFVLAQEFTDKSFDFENLFTMTIDEILKFIIRDYIARNVAINTLQLQCIKDMLDDHLVLSVQTDIINAFQQLRSAVTAIKNLTQFYIYDFVPNVSEIPPTEDCVNRFLTLHCAACAENIPSLCRSVCGPLIRGCFSPFRQGLSDQLDILWNVTQQLFYVVEDLVGEILFLEPGIMNIDFESTSELRTFILGFLAPCQTPINPFTFTAQAADNFPTILIPDVILRNITNLQGSYVYGENGPEFCQPFPVANCWNGQRELDVDRDDEFIEDDIQNQNNNPVVSFDRQKLVDLANSLGTPVSDFLVQEEFQQILPNEIIIPPGEAFSLVIMENEVIAPTSFSSFMSPSPTNEDFSPSFMSPSPTSEDVFPRFSLFKSPSPTNEFLSSPSSSTPTSTPTENEPSSATCKFASFAVIVFAYMLSVIFTY